MRRHIFVHGADNHNMWELEKLPDRDRYFFHTLFSFDETRATTAEGVRWLIEESGNRLSRFDGQVDAVIGYWDFPVSTTLPIICREHGLCTPTLESVLKCEHKYWSRLLQIEAAPECTPRFFRFDPFDEHCRDAIDMPYPFWIKPIKSYSSQLGFRIRNGRDFEYAVSIIRRRIGKFSNPFNVIFSYADIPDDIGVEAGGFCIAEEIIGGRQCTLEGHVFDGEVYIHGIIDSFRYPNGSSFQRYQYPSRMPVHVKSRMNEYARRVMRHIGLDGSGFNIEFYYDKKQDKIWLLEINPRVSQSHAELFRKVDGVPNLKITVDIALCEKPVMPHREGEFRTAAKFFYRTFENGRVIGAPADNSIQRIEEEFPGTIIENMAPEGAMLSELPEQDSYSFNLATLFIGARNTADLLRTYHACTDKLHYRIDRNAAKTQTHGKIRVH